MLDGSGTGTIPLAIPAFLPIGTNFYVQAFSTGAVNELSNAVPFRVVDAAPSGRRVTIAVAATPDGAKAYVAHLQDGSVSVIDAVNDVKLTELPITPSASGLPYRALDIGIDPEGRHAFVVNAAASTLAVIHVATDSVAGQIPVARGSRRIGFDFSNTKRIYVTNEVRNAVLVFDESPNGTFVEQPEIPLEGKAPGPLLVLPDGRLVVGHRATHEIEVIDPQAPPGSQTVARTSTSGLPFDVVLGDNEILIPTFFPVTLPNQQGINQVLRISLSDFQITGTLFDNVGTDYVDMAVTATQMAVVAASSGTAIIGDPTTGAQLDNIEIAPFNPTATPQDSTFVSADKLYVTNYFRESVRAIDLTAGPPFGLGVEIPLAWSGQVRVPLTGDLTPAEDGDWFFRSVNLFGAGALTPNIQTCFSCHVDGVLDNFTRNRQVPPAWGLADTAPYGWNGDLVDLGGVVAGAISAHNSGGTTPPADGADLIVEFLEQFQPPASIHLTANGALTADAAAGKILFEGVAQCAGCHAAPLFIPLPPFPLTFQSVGTGLSPANVPSLRGIWATAPYLHDGSAATLLDVLTINPADAHGTRAAPLTDEERGQLVEYLNSL